MTFCPAPIAPQRLLDGVSLSQYYLMGYSRDDRHTRPVEYTCFDREPKLSLHKEYEEITASSTDTADDVEAI